jgi:hypothetical protein
MRTFAGAVSAPAADCVMVTALPATVRVVLRDDPAVLAVNENNTVPSPEPEAPVVMVSQRTFSVAVHEQPDEALTVTAPLPDADGRFCVVGVTLNVQFDDPAACDTDTVCPAIVAVVERVLVVVFCAAVSVTVPLPVPVAPFVIVSHEAPLVAVHVQAEVVLTTADSAPPAAGADRLAGDTV